MFDDLQFDVGLSLLFGGSCSGGSEVDPVFRTTGIDGKAALEW